MNHTIAGRMYTLAAEYVALVEPMRAGQYADDAEYQALSSQRTLIHEELIELTGVTERRAMYGHFWRRGAET